MDFWQFHSYPYNGEWLPGSPWLGSSVDDYEFDAPLVLGEFPCADKGANDGYDIPAGTTTAELVKFLTLN